MLKMKTLLTTIILASALTTQAQINNAKSQLIKVDGNCEMCKATIEKSATHKKISKVNWNPVTKQATITYDSTKTSLDGVLKNIALSGYDNQMYLAPDDIYSKLPDCCKYKRLMKPIIPAGQLSKSTEYNSQNHQANSTKDKPAANQFQLIYDNYFMIKDALVQSNSSNASTKATALLFSLKNVKMAALKSTEHTIWMNIVKELKEDATTISSAKDIAVQRNAFTRLSGNMYTLLKTSKYPDKIYYQHCPMFNDGKGANWLSKENAVKNPYYGAAMLSCGKTTETIPENE